MPTYIYQDTESGENYEITMSVAEMERREIDGFIDHEGRKLQRNMVAEHAPAPSGCASWPMKSDACGVHPSQVGDAYQHSVAKGVPTQFDQRTGQAIFTDRIHRKRYLAAHGFHDRNGGYGD